MRRRRGVRKINAKKKEMDGIKFASTLEVTQYKLLKEAGIEFSYEGKSYDILKKTTYTPTCLERKQRRSKEMVENSEVKGISYTPDFIGKGEKWIIEVKGYANESFPLRWKLFKNLMKLRKHPPMLFKPTSKVDCEQVVEFLIEKGYGK